MPPCHFATRTLLRNCRAPRFPPSPSPWQRPRQQLPGGCRYSTRPTSDALDLSSSADADSAYLDLILGPNDRRPGHSDAASRPSYVPLTAEKPQDGRSYASETRGTARAYGEEGPWSRTAEDDIPWLAPSPSEGVWDGGGRRRGHTGPSRRDAATTLERAQHVPARHKLRTQSPASRSVLTQRGRGTARTKASGREATSVRTAKMSRVDKKAPYMIEPPSWILSERLASKTRAPRSHLADFMAQTAELLRSDEGDGLAMRRPPKIHPDAIPRIVQIHERLQAQSGDTTPVRFSHLIDAQFWHHALLWFLYYEPHLAVDFLVATDSASNLKIRIIRHCLKFMVMRSLRADDKDATQELMSSLTHAAGTLSRRWAAKSDPRAKFHGLLYGPLIQHCSTEKVQEFYNSLKGHHDNVLWDTWLDFAFAFAKRDHHNQALDALLEAKNAGAPLDSLLFRSCCAKLLRKSVRQPGGLRATIRIVDNLVKIGLRLDNHLANIVMLNAVESGDLQTAFSIYHSLRDHGLQADNYTYAVLLKGCKGVIDDASILNETIRDALSHVDVLQSPVVANEIMHCLALHHTKHHPENAYETVADAYAQMYDLEPLRQLGLLIPKLSRIENTESKRPPPSSHAIYILVVTYLEGLLFSTGYSMKPAYEIYQRFKKLVKSGITPFTFMTKTDHIYNAFLSHFIKSKSGLIHAAELVKDMQRSSPPGSNYEHCRPTVWTWSIFLHGFTRHRQMQLAEQVLKYMRGKGIEPNEVTYNTLVGGYSAVQDIEGVLNTLRQMQTDGKTWDHWTIPAMNRIKDQAQLQGELARRKRAAAAMDFTGDLRDELVERVASAKLDEMRVQERAKEAEKTAEEDFGGEDMQEDGTTSIQGTSAL